MPGETKHGIECTEFEALLGDALDGAGQLSPARKENFDAHRRVCEICGPLFAEVQAGRQLLRSLALEPVEPPAHLVHNILAATSGVVSTRPLAVRPDGRTTPFGERVREWWDSYFTPASAFVRQPRVVMLFGMIFFSFSMVATLAGVKPSDAAQVDLRPSAVRPAYNGAQIKLVQHHDNIRCAF